jgi:hypothetical protein
LYDYATLIVGQLWVYRRLATGAGGVRRWVAVGILLFMLSVPLWVGPEYDGYWLALGMGALLVLLGAREEGRNRGQSAGDLL